MNVQNESCADCYFRVVSSMVAPLHRCGWNALWLAVGTLLLEPWSALKSGALMVLNVVRSFHFFGLNPSELSPAQVNTGRAVLCIHGYLHNQTAWLNLARKCHNQGIAIFTVNLPAAPCSRRDKEILESKWAEIETLYASKGVNDFKVSVVGHSRGAGLAKYLSLKSECWDFDDNGGFVCTPIDNEPSRVNQRDHLGSIVLIGSNTLFNSRGALPLMLSQAEGQTKMIDAKRDLVVEQCPPERVAEDRSVVDTGHLGLLFSDEVNSLILPKVLLSGASSESRRDLVH